MNTVLSKPNVIIVCGPTGVGKTSVGIELAKYVNGEVINADSMQIYKFMDIGTAKPTPEEQNSVPHHMIDIIDPDEPFDAEMYSTMARKQIDTLTKKRSIPIVVGGTGFYIKALEHGLFDPGPSDSKIRNRLRETAEISGTHSLYEQLRQCDPDTADSIHPNDTYRIIRALEVYQVTGKGVSAYRAQHNFSDSPFRTLKIGLKMERKKLYERINKRVEIMLKAGFLDEVRGLLDKGYNADLKSMQSIGYRHISCFIMGEIDWEEAIRTMKRDTRRYAKRQLTWFKGDESVKWAEPKQIQDIYKMVDCFLNN